MDQRQCVILKGEREWCQIAAQTLLADYDLSHSLWLTEYSPEQALNSAQNKAKYQLGKEFDAVVFDAIDEFNPDSFGAVMGTIKQGGVLIVYFQVEHKNSLFMQRFMQIVTQFSQQQKQFHIVQQNQILPSLSPPSFSKRSNSDHIVLTDDQQQAVTAILKVVHGHRRRPLVLSADRGRGKSACLGIAAANLINEGKQTILVTAPSLATVDVVFQHAHRLLVNAELTAGLISLADAQIRFVAPDVLIESDPKADLLLVDEAAVIPAAMLEKLLQKYSRIVFSTTLHGYEGTGQGFAIRFQQILDLQTPNWHHYQMKMPIRWSENDSLEAFSFASLLLATRPVDEKRIADVTVEQCQFEQIDRQKLINNEQDLQQLFGLMVLAHYRTRPSDLQMMLDREDVSVYVMRFQGHIVASAWLVKEGQIDEALSSAIFSGQRRLKGHLLPQSLLAHVGMTDAGKLSYQRIIRIATHPAAQQRGIATALLDNINAQLDCDIVGASFAASTNVINFWSQLAFSAVRVGLHKDEVSGSHSIMMLKANSALGDDLLTSAKNRFQQYWPYLLVNQFKYLDTAVVVHLSQLLAVNETKLTEWDQQEIKAFCEGQRAYEFSQIALWKHVCNKMATADFLALDEQQQQLCIKLVMQQQAWPEVLKQSQYSGKTEAVTALRQVIRLL